MFSSSDPKPQQPLNPEPEGADWDPRGPEYRAFALFAKLTRTKRDLERQLDDVKRQLNSISFQLRDLLSSGFGPTMKVDGLSIFLRRELWVRKYEWVTTARVCEALKRNGLGHFVAEGYNTSSLSAHVRGLELAHKDELKAGMLGSVADLLPPELAKVLNTEPTYTVIAREKEEE